MRRTEMADTRSRSARPPEAPTMRRRDRPAAQDRHSGLAAGVVEGVPGSPIEMPDDRAVTA